MRSTVIGPYDEVLTKQRANKLIPQIVKKIESYDCIVYFKGGAGKEYLNCMKEACRRAGKRLISLGYKNMGGINDLPKVIQLVERQISKVKSAQIKIELRSEHYLASNFLTTTL